MRRRRPSDETLVALRARLEDLPPRSPERGALVQACADLHDVSAATVYRALREQFRPRALHRRDHGRPRKLSRREMERYCELVAAMKLRTTNQKGHHLSTVRALELLVEHGVETPEGLVQAPPGLLTRTTVNRYLRAWGLDDRRMAQPPPAVRFQAERANECWQFDMSPSDLKQVPAPLWVEPGRGPPTLMLFSVVDDRSGVAYQEYRCVYGEDVAAALRFLFNAMAPKDEDGLVLQGIPGMLYLDNGPVAKSGVFRRVMTQLGIQVQPHMPKGSDGRRVTARSKGLGAAPRLLPPGDRCAMVDGILDPAAVDLLASRLHTPLQIEQHLTLALETGYQASERPVGEAIVDSVLSKQIDDLEPTLMRHGYSVKVLCEMLGTKPAEVRALFRQTLEPDRARELKEQLLAAGLPV